MHGYPVWLGQERVGTVELSEEGLYYHIRAKCQLSGEVPCRLVVGTGEQTTHLGVLVPENGCFGIHTKLAKKKLDDTELTFCVMPKYAPTQRTLYPLCPEEPFAYLDRLYTGYLCRVGEQMCLALTNPIQDQPGNDLSQKYLHG